VTTTTETPAARREALLRKVRGLLAKAEDPAATPAEAEVFSAKAEELMAKYAIDAALIDARSDTREKPEARRFDIDPGYNLPKATMWAVIAQAHRCKVVRHRTGRRTAVTVVGYPSDIDVVELLFTSLSLQAANGMIAASRERPWLSAGEVRSFRTSFLYGFASTVQRRLEEIRRRTEAEAVSSEPSTALVLRDRSQDVEQLYADMFPSLGKARATANNGAGFRVGRAAGERADLNQTRVGGSRTAIGGR
jgi:hypothetical protein